MTKSAFAESTPAALRRAALSELRRRADPAKAEPMQRYMKSTMRYHGVPAPILRAICREVFIQHPLASKRDWQDAVLTLWRDASRREERYIALELLAWRAYAPHRTLDILPMLEELIVDGAWWDYVDPLATHRLRELLVNHPAAMGPLMREWSRDPNLWKRRSAILCQIGRKQDTDLELLFDCLEPNLNDRELKAAAPQEFLAESRQGSTRRRSLESPPTAASQEFFIRKAVGWALRDYAWFDVATVERWVEEHAHRLSGLSRREALKNRDQIRAKG